MKCTNGDKIGYRDLESAKEARKSLKYHKNPDFQDELFIYLCPYCNRYHLTKRKS